MTRLTDREIRLALEPDVPATQRLTADIANRIRTVSQHHAALRWPWSVAQDAAWVDTSRDRLLRVAVVALVALAAMATVVVGSRLLQHEPGRLMGIRSGDFRVVAERSGELLALPSVRDSGVINFTSSSDGELFAIVDDDRDLTIWNADDVLSGVGAHATGVTTPGPDGVVLGSAVEWVPGRHDLLVPVDEHGLGRLYIVDRDSRVWRAVSPDHMDVHAFAAAPDKRHVALAGQLRGEAGIWIVDLGAPGVAQDSAAYSAAKVPVAPADAISLRLQVAEGMSWDHGSDRLALTVQPPTGNATSIWTVGTEDGDVRAVSQTILPGVEAIWSPDAAWIAFVVGRDVDGFVTGDLYVAHPDGSAQHLVQANAEAISWSPDSASLLLWAHSWSGHACGAVGEIGLDGSARSLLVAFDAPTSDGLGCPGFDFQWYPGTN